MPANNPPLHTQVHTTLIRQAAPSVQERRRLFDWGTRRTPARKPLIAARNKKDKPAAKPVSSVTTVAFTAKPVSQNYTTSLSARSMPGAAEIASAPVSSPAKRSQPARTERVTGFNIKAAEKSIDAIDIDTIDKEARDNFRPLNFGERMLRNTAVCVAVLLCAIAVKSIDAPITQAVSGELREWVTMDLDESLGSLKFVQNLLPDAALVFWHIGATQSFSEPTVMALSHSWKETEPYLAYSADKQTPVTASAPGDVMSVTVSDDHTSTVRIRHEDGLETIYGNLISCTVREGDAIETAQTIGAASTLYFEIRGEGRSMNPAPLMADKP
ncbi:MAG: M23 family metallopeptidase [Oscillospiraceae bacterium]|nr:M23 family metallopeptidase [Oscillospiraceae bacterium]